MRCEQTHHKRTAEKCSRAKVKHMSLNGRLRCYLIARGQAYISRTCHIAPKIQSVTTYSNTRTFLALPVNTMAKKEDTQRPKRCTRMGVYARSESFTPNDRTFGGRVAEESRLVIAGALPTAFISSSCCNLIVAIPPTTSIFLHYYYQQKLTTPCTSRPLSELTQLQALCGKENRTFVPPIDLNRPDVVSLKSRGRPIIRNVATTKKSLSSDSRSTAPIVIDQFGVLGQPHRCAVSSTSGTHFYSRLLGKIPCHTDHIYDIGRNIGGRQAIDYTVGVPQ